MSSINFNIVLDYPIHTKHLSTKVDTEQDNVKCLDVL